jgi:cyclase
MIRTRLSMPICFAMVATALSCGGTPPPPPEAPLPETPPAVTPAPAPTPSATPSAAPAPSASASATAADDRFAKVVIKATKVAGNIYILEGAGGNIGVSVGDDGIVIVDDQFAPLAPKIRAALKEITDKPLRFVINTHLHGDHTGSNAVFSAEASIVAHENVRQRLASGGPSMELGGKPLGEPRPPAAKEALPIVTFNDKLSLHLNGEEIRAIHLPSGHTDGDAVIYFTKSNVVHMGDDFVTYGFPFIDLSSGGSVKGIIAAVEKIVAELPADVKIIPGHGNVSTIDDMKKFTAMLRDTMRIVEAEVKKKKTLEQIQQAKVLAKYDELGKGFIKSDMFVEILFRELTKKDAPKTPAKAPAKAPVPH